MPIRFAAAAAALSLASAAHGEILERSATFAGTTVQYEVLLPPGFDAAKAHPLVLVFTGGAQSLAAARNTLEVDWQAEAEKRGYVVVSPAAPEGDLYFEGGDRVFPAFLDMLRKDYRIAGKIHIAGHSNGGLSAFHLAAKYPAYFSTLTGYPGMLQDPQNQPPGPLRPLCIYMHVGGLDRFWLSPMQDQMRQMRSEGFNAPQIDLSRRLFDEIESCR